MFRRIFLLSILTLVSISYPIAHASDVWFVSSLNPKYAGKNIYLANSEEIQIPYVIVGQKISTSSPAIEHPLIHIVENTMQKNNSNIDRVVVFDTGKEGQIYTGINLELTPDSKKFRKVARVFISDTLLGANSPVWRELEKRSIVYNYSEENFKVENLNIAFPDVSTRYIKVQFEENSSVPAPMNISGARVEYDIDEVERGKKIKDYIAGNFDISNESDKKNISLEQHVFQNSESITSVTIQVSNELASFRKNVSIESSEDGVNWQVVTTGEVYRISSPVYEGEMLTISCDPLTAPYVRIQTDLEIKDNAYVTVQEMAVLFKVDELVKDDIKINFDQTGMATSSYVLQKELVKVGNIVPRIVELQATEPENVEKEGNNLYIIYSAIFLIAGILGYLRYRTTRKA